ncbi:PEP-CTERM sorting domain-containing protein [Oryzisolibacter sp. LB2S]|uniref:Npun_F0296 family exosortase-dependent surface protein n=1 Tax=Alicycliphilus soli TaxID=3228789 RepID=UPI003457459F
MITLHKTLFSAAALGLAAASAHASFLVTYEAPGVANSTSGFTYHGVETFDTRTVGTNQTFTTDFGTSGGTTTITGTYQSVQILPADQWGGAGNTGNYAVAFGASPYELTLAAQDSSSNPVPVTYFGYWLSALDNGNQVEFYRGSSLLFSFDPAQVLALTGNCPSSPYCGNPATGANASQPYVFLNFYDQSGLGFDRVRFLESPAVGGYESDNHTVGYYENTSGTPIPEPASLALVGLALGGLAVSRRRKA